MEKLQGDDVPTVYQVKKIINKLMRQQVVAHSPLSPFNHNPFRMEHVPLCFHADFLSLEAFMSCSNGFSLLIAFVS